MSDQPITHDHPTTRLTAAIEETAALARTATPGPWVFNPEDPMRDVVVERPMKSDDYHIVAEMPECNEHPDRQKPDAAHIAHHNPAATLRMCQAHSKIVDAYVEFQRRRDELEQADALPVIIAGARAETAALAWVIERLITGYGITTHEDRT